MALINAPIATVIRVTLVDLNGDDVTKDFVVPSAVWNPATGLIADLKTIRDNLVTALDAITDGLIYRAFIVLNQVDDTATLGAGKVSDIATVVSNLSTQGKKFTFRIPAPTLGTAGIFLADSGRNAKIVDTADVALNAFIDLFQATGGSFTVSDGEVVDDTTPLVSGKLITRKST